MFNFNFYNQEDGGAFGIAKILHCLQQIRVKLYEYTFK
jgi:hypothetical protein